MEPKTRRQTCIPVRSEIVANAEICSDGLIVIGKAVAFVQIASGGDGWCGVKLDFPLVIYTIVVAIRSQSLYCRRRNDGEEKEYFDIFCHEFDNLRIGWIDIIWAKVGIFLFGWVFLRGKSRDTKIFRRELMGGVGKMRHKENGGQGQPPLRYEKGDSLR